MANNTNQATYQHQRRTLFLICLGFFFSIILLYKVLNPVVIITCLGIIAIRYGEVKRTISEHPAWLNNLLSVFIIATIVALLTLYGFRTYLVNAFINLLVGSIALKFLEIRQERDLNIQVIALFFLSSLTFVFSYEWYMLLYMMRMYSAYLGQRKDMRRVRSFTDAWQMRTSFTYHWELTRK